MRHYELVTVLSPILNQDQSVEAWDGIKEFITTRESEILREQIWGTRRLAYPCLLYTSPSPRDRQKSRMPSSA